MTNAFSKKTWQTARIHFYAVLVNEKRRQTIPKALDNEKIAESGSKGYLVGSKFCRLISRSRLLLTFLTVVEYVLTNYSFEKCRLVVRSRVLCKQIDQTTFPYLSVRFWSPVSMTTWVGNRLFYSLITIYLVSTNMQCTLRNGTISSAIYYQEMKTTIAYSWIFNNSSSWLLTDAGCKWIISSRSIISVTADEFADVPSSQNSSSRFLVNWALPVKIIDLVHVR